MYLESLELQGFKSFPDKTILTFDKGITAVVGPNGSGKSNIGDAVRWVLGEQSSKSLRGGKMEDVIFSGTEKRKPMGFAQVTLNIVNSEGTLQIPSERVSVTRKLYRSGESEYMINGAKVLLKNIYELFMDTGLGRDGYSIVGQGKIAEIVSAKSSERRQIFEEAAGISKFRYKKAEAERKLEAAQNNILRLRDIVKELEDRVGPLKTQSEKAEKFLEYSDTKKSLEITVWVRQLDDLKKKLDEISENLLINTNEYNGVEADISRLEEELTKLSESMQDNALRTEELRNMILESERANTQIHSDIAVCENDIRHAEETIGDIKKQQELSANTNAENKQAMLDKLESVKESEDELESNRAEYVSVSKELLNAASEKDSFDSKSEEVRSELNKLYIKQSEYSVTISNGEDSVLDLKAQLEVFDGREEELRTSLEDLAKEKTDCVDGLSVIGEKTEELNNRIGGISKLYSSRTEKLEAAKKQFDDMNLSIRDKEQRIRMLTDLERSMEGFAHSVKHILKASSTGQLGGVCGSVAQLIKVEQKYSVAVETALGGAMQNIITENEDVAKRGIRLLQESKAGRATFLPITSVKGSKLAERGLEDCEGFVALAVDLVSFDPKYEGVYNSLLGRIAVAEDIDLASLIAKKYGYKFRIVTLDGQVVNAGGSYTGGFTSKSSGVLTRKNDIEKLTKEKSSLEEKLAELKISNEKLSAETEKLHFDIEGAKEELSVVSADKIRFESEIKRIESLISQTQTQLENFGTDKENLKNRITETESGIKLAGEKLSETEKSIKEKESLVSANDEQRAEMQKKREALSEKLSGIKLRETELLKDIEALKTEITRLEAQSLEIGDNSARLIREIDEQNRFIAEKRAEIDALKAKLEGSKNETESINAKIDELRSESMSMEQKSNETRRSIREMNDSKEKFSREMTRLEERKISVQSDYDKIIANMSEQYNMYLSEAVTIAKPVENLLAIQKELAEIKQKIRSLGNVNVAAIEEYKEVSERYKFMSSELSDVENAKRELEKLIEELTETMKKQFSESFELIRENFKQVFFELQGGGRAELTLTDPNDVLESGIEINAAPPGKIINNISLLSGGEQSVVAVCIYLAILKIRPAPFCILDEIDAALDDINITKYAKYLRNFTDTTQFILVTHRRSSMDEADVLYGVVMQEQGISRMLRLEQPPADSN